MNTATLASENWLIIPEIYPMQMPRCRIDNDWLDVLTTTDGTPVTNFKCVDIMIDYLDEENLQSIYAAIINDVTAIDNMILYNYKFDCTISLEKDNVKDHYILVFTPAHSTLSISNTPSKSTKYYINKMLLLEIIAKLYDYCNYKL